FSHYARSDTEAPVLSRPVGENLVRRYALKNSTSEGVTRLGPAGRIDGGPIVPIVIGIDVPRLRLRIRRLPLIGGARHVALRLRGRNARRGNQKHLGNDGRGLTSHVHLPFHSSNRRPSTSGR